MNTEFDYKGYKGSCVVSIEDGCIHGRILDINDIITYEGETVDETKRAFEIALDEYIDHCLSIGKEPNKPFSGTFNVRIGHGLHKAANQLARQQEKSLNEVIRESIELLLRQQDKNLSGSHAQAITEHYIKKWSLAVSQIEGNQNTICTKTSEVSSAIIANHRVCNDTVIKEEAA